MKNLILLLIAFLMAAPVFSQETVITSFEDDFSGETLFAGWDTAAPSHTLTQADGILTIAVDKTDAEKWNGLTMGFGDSTLLDIAQNGGYFSVDLKADSACLVDIAVWDTTGQYNPGINQMNLEAGADWTTFTFEYSGDNLLHLKWNGDVLGTIDASIIDHLLMTFNGGSAWTGNVYMDNLKIGDAAVPPTIISTFADDFSGETLFAGWDTAAPSHTLTQADGMLTIAVDKTDAEKWNGLTMGFGENTLLDIAQNGGYFSVDLKADSACLVDIALWDANGQYNPGINQMSLEAGADWATFAFEYSGDNLLHLKWNGDVLGTVDAAAIDHLLMTFNGGSAWTGNVYMDNLKIGDAAVPPTIITSFEDDFSGEALFAGWDTAAPSHTLTQADGMLTITVDKTDAEKWNGLTMGFGENTLLDIAKNGGYFSVDLKADAACTVDIALWDANGQYNPGINQMSLEEGADWTTFAFEYAGDNLLHLKWNGDVLGTVDAAAIDHLLMTFNGGSAWTGNVYMDNLKIGDAAIPSTTITSFEDDFEGETLFEGWDTEAASHTLTQADGMLTIAVDKTDAEKWNGLTMGFGENTILDLAQSGGYFSVELKADAACTVDIALWDANGEYNPGINQMSLEAGADWTTFSFEYAGDNLLHLKWDGSVLGTVDATAIDHLLMTFNGGSAWTGNVYMDNLKIGDAAIPSTTITTFEDDFEGETLFEGWDTEAASHTLTQADGMLTIAVDKTDAEKWNGLTMGFGENTILDLTKSGGYFSVDLKADAACTVDIALWDANGEYNPGINQMSLEAGADWTTFSFEYAGDNLLHLKWDGSVLGTVDATVIDHLLMTFNGGSAWTGNVYMDNLKIGEAAVPSTVITTYSDDFESADIFGGWDTEAASHTLTQADGMLTIAVDKTDAEKWNGLTMGFGENTVLDMSALRGLRVDLKADSDCAVDIAVWDENGEYNPGKCVLNLVGGDDWVTFKFEYTDDNLVHLKWDGSVLGNVDPSKIDHLLMTFNGGSAWTGNVYMDNLSVGVEVTGTNDKLQPSLRCFPNPVSNQLQIQNLEQGQPLSIYNAKGKRIYYTVANQQNLTINTTSWLQGIYFINTINSTMKVMKK